MIKFKKVRAKQPANLFGLEAILGRFKAKSNRSSNRLPLFARICLFFYDRPRLSLLIWLAILAFGIASYTTLLKRGGFPAINVPYSFVQGSYLVNDPSQVDSEIGKPLSEIITDVDKVKLIDTQSGSDFFTIVIQYEEGTDAKAGNAAVELAVRAANVLPLSAAAKFEPLAIGVNERGDDMLVAFYARSGSLSTQTLYDRAAAAAKNLTQKGGIALASKIEAIDPFARGVDPATGQPAVSQQRFDRFGIAEADQNQFYESIEIGIKGAKGFDVLTLDKQVRAALSKLNNSPEFSDFSAKVSFSLAPQINDQVSGLQQSLTEGLAAILIVSALLIALRASLITVSAMVMVLMATLAVLFTIGYTLNTITLFSLILCLSLIVDDTIIMVEAIDAQRRRNKRAREAIAHAARKISRVMVAATLTAAMAFVPMIFIGGILGSFIRAIPITVITSLLVSLLVALTFIPLMARALLLRPKQMGQGESGNKESPSHRLERFIAGTLARPILWTNHVRKRQIGLGLAAVFIGLGFIAAGGMLFSKVGFNIFAPSKDSDQLGIQATFISGGSIEQAQAIADEADAVVNQQLGVNFKQASYYNTGTTQIATLTLDLKSFKDRDVTAPQLAEQLEKNLAGVQGAQFKVSQIDVGPPLSAFTVRIQSDDQPAAQALAKELSVYLSKVKLERPDGSVARMKGVTISNTGSVARRDAKLYISVSAEFDGDDTSTLVLLAENAVKKEFDDKRLARYDLSSKNLFFDIGQEEENQDSFKTLLFAFPVVLVAMYLLLTIQFRSLLQPALIFMAIPFSLFGITAGLWLTDNAFSFFTMLGFFALIGLSIKNTILLTDYANQARRAGSNAVEAVAISLQERFRPLIATSLTAIVSLIPLYLSNPFWEGLTVTLMFGLLSSTFLVVTVFPYYYLGAEYLRLKIARRTFVIWLILSVAISVALSLAGIPAAVPLGFLAITAGIPVVAKLRG